MDRKFLRWIFAGCDAFIFDPRGTIDSDCPSSKNGFYSVSLDKKSHLVPSEGGYYLDAEAVFQKILAAGYPHERIYVSGYCEGAAIGAYVVQKHRVHFIAENPFDSMQEMVKNFNFVGKWVHPYVIAEIQSEDPAIASRVQQDGFDNVNKFKDLAPSNGKFILIHTVPDLTAPPHCIDKLRRAIGDAGPVYIHATPFSGRDGHTTPPSESEETWRWMAHVM